MFSHRNRARRAQALSLGILGAAMAATAARAADTPGRFVMVAYSNRSGGAQLVSGDYRRAAQPAQQHAALALPDPQATDTNRCVALAMTHQLAQARAACDAAVRDARGGELPLLSWGTQPRHESAAVAYSNRAVLHWLEADPEAAQQDLARAQGLAPQASFVVRNLSAMQAHQTVGAPPSATAALAAAQ